MRYARYCFAVNNNRSKKWIKFTQCSCSSKSRSWRVKLTPEGITYYQRAKDVLSNLSELDGLFQQDATSISGKLRIDIPPGIAKSLLLPRLSDFLYLHPGIELELSSHDRPVDILHDGFDCVIRTGALPEDGVIARPLGNACRNFSICIRELSWN